MSLSERKNIWRLITYRKPISDEKHRTELARVLTLFDLVCLGVGSTLGLGIYVLAGSVAYNTAGPAVTVSFAIAAIASVFAGICYAEFASRVVIAGSAYVYSYVTVGEFVAFTIGWNLILEYAIGTSSVARGMSSYFYSLIGYNITESTGHLFPNNSTFLAEYPDFLSATIILMLTILLCLGVKESSLLNNVFTTINLLTICIVIGAGIFFINIDNWMIPADKVPKNFGTGGFAPYSFKGIFEGAARCFFGYVGFDCIATTGEEALNPRRNVPLAILITLIIIFLAYLSISAVLTLMVPYFELDVNAPFLYAFDAKDMQVIKWIVSLGAVFGLSAALLGAMFPLPRILYSMGQDRVLCSSLGKIHPRTHTPIISTVLTGLLAAAMALTFDLVHLIDMMSVGTLLAYTIVAVCVLLLRYEDPKMDDSIPSGPINFIQQFYNGPSYQTPNTLSTLVSKTLIVLFLIGCILWCMVTNIFGLDKFLPQFAIVIISLFLIVCMVSMCMQPVTTISLSFKVCLVPFTPCLSIFINLFLMFQLNYPTWIRFTIWLIVGYIAYFTYVLKKYFLCTRLQRIYKHRIYKQLHRTLYDFKVIRVPLAYSMKYVRKLITVPWCSNGFQKFIIKLYNLNLLTFVGVSSISSSNVF